METGHIAVAHALFLTVLSLCLLFMSFLSPYPERHRSLLTVIPNITAEQYLASGASVFDAPTVIIGLFGSCSRRNSQSFFNCTNISRGNFSLGVLPDDIPKSILRPANDSLRVLIGISIGLLVTNIFTWPITWTYMPFRGKMYPWMAYLTEFLIEYIPLVSFFFGLIGFTGVYTIFLKICEDFNEYQVQHASELTRGSFLATTGNGFLFAWVAYGFIFHAMTVFWVAYFRQPPPAPPPASDDKAKV